MNILNKVTQNPFDKEIERVLSDIGKMSPESEEYEVAVKNLKVLCDARGVKTNRSISSDTILTVTTNLVGLLLILNYEQMHVVTSKAFSFVFRKS